MNRTRTAAVIRLSRQQAIDVLDQTLTTARAVDAAVALIRPAAFCAVMKADPALISWERCGDLQHRPVYRGMTLEISDQLYPARQEKVVGPFARGMRAVPAFGKRP